MDGFVEHGFATLWYCHCGRVFAVSGFAPDPEVPLSEVDLAPGPMGTPRPGVWINARRWSRLRHLDEVAPLTAELPNGDQSVVYAAYESAVADLQAVSKDSAGLLSGDDPNVGGVEPKDRI